MVTSQTFVYTSRHRNAVALLQTQLHYHFRSSTHGRMLQDLCYASVNSAKRWHMLGCNVRTLQCCRTKQSYIKRHFTQARSHQPTLHCSVYRRGREHPKASMACSGGRDRAKDTCECARRPLWLHGGPASARFTRWIRDGESWHGERHTHKLHAARFTSDVNAHRRNSVDTRPPWCYRGIAVLPSDCNR